MAKEEEKVRRGCVEIDMVNSSDLDKFDISKKGNLPDSYSPEYYKEITKKITEENSGMIAKKNYIG